MPRLGVIGHLSRDIVADAPPRFGGGPWHAARALRLIGEDAVLVAKSHEPADLPALFVSDAETTSFSFAYDADGVRTMRVESIGTPWRDDEIPPLDGVEWLQVAPLLRGDFDASLLAQLARGRMLLLDGQGLARARETGPLRLDGAFDATVLEHVTMLKLAVEEAEAIGDVDVPELIVTDGTRGAWVNGTHVAADVVSRDPTGAGDAFAIAYLAARADGSEPVEAGRRATAVVAELLAQ
ncbi:MAG TPA: PfkB family carbohydrate kinase [Gaiellaceae bacterium]|nr:PfkB family carbohydrate kinase [Gaiellaceae bacterium]